MNSKVMLCLLGIGLTTLACGQSKESNIKENIVKNELVEKYVEKTLSDMQHYEVQPMYMMRIGQHSCTFEILVNDDLIYQELSSTDKLASSIKINSRILKSGLQTVTVRQYPLGDLVQKEFGEEHHEDILTLLDDSNVTIDIIRVDDIKKYTMEGEKSVLVHHSPKNAEGKFKGTGLPYYEYTFSFEAEVPYEFEAFTKGVDLRTLDQTELKAKYEAYITHYKELLATKNIDKLFELSYPLELRAARSEYQTEEFIREKYSELYESFSRNDMNFYHMDGAEYVFFGNGRLISKKYPSGLLESRRLKHQLFRGKSGVFFLYANETMVFYLAMDLYMPKNKGNHLELVR